MDAFTVVQERGHGGLDHGGDGFEIYCGGGPPGLAGELDMGSEGRGKLFLQRDR